MNGWVLLLVATFLHLGWAALGQGQVGGDEAVTNGEASGGGENRRPNLRECDYFCEEPRGSAMCIWTCDGQETAGPRISVSSPTEGESVSGLITVTGWAHTFFSMPKVLLAINGQPFKPVSLSTGLPAPHVCGGSPGVWHHQCNRNSGFEAKIETRNLPNGVHTLRVGAISSIGFPSYYDHTIIVSNSCFDATLPSIRITPPTLPLKAGKSFKLSAEAVDDVEIKEVEFLVDGVSVGTDTSTPYSFDWDTTSSSMGPHTVTAVARDSCSNSREDSLLVILEQTGLRRGD